MEGKGRAARYYKNKCVKCVFLSGNAFKTQNGHNSSCDNTMITKNPKTSDTKCISKKKVLKIPLKSPISITISGIKVREGGRTVLSVHVALIIKC